MRQKKMKALDLDDVKIEWLGHSGVRLSANDKVVYVDPYNLNTFIKADLILITHEHYDHCSIADLKKVSKPGTVIIAPADCISQLRKIENATFKIPEPNKRIDLNGMGGIYIETVPAYNTAKMFHPKDNNWLGYIINVNRKRIYHAGDTDFIPEMKEIREIDVAFLPVGGTYTMDAEEAANASDEIRPKTAVPIHYGAIAGSVKDAEKFKALSGCNVEIMEKVE
jgi:L-ascorbate metabolism protein UlaG (beta-lactamase superfamily)